MGDWMIEWNLYVVIGHISRGTDFNAMVTKIKIITIIY